MSPENYRKFGYFYKSFIFNILLALFWSLSGNFRGSFGAHPCDTLLGPSLWVFQHQSPTASFLQCNRSPRIVVQLADVVPEVELA